jgi:membrane-associated phospholipid phosphatase
LFAVAGCAALAIDVPLATLLAEWQVWGLEPLCRLAEVFGHGVGVAMIALSIAVLDPASRGALPRVLIAAYGSGLLANTLKLLVARSRPQHFTFDGPVGETFVGWLPLLGDSTLQSFPSAHVATATGFAVGLAWLYPRGRILFPALAGLVAMQRVFGEAHFLSDVLWGAAVGSLFASLCLGRGWLARLCDRLELSASRLILGRFLRSHAGRQLQGVDRG